VRGIGRSALLALAVWLGAGAAAAAQTQAALSGRVSRQDGTPLPGVMVLVEQTGAVEWTAADGVYRFPKMAPGTYSLLLTLGGYSTTRDVTVNPGTPAREDIAVDWPLSFVETMVVEAASRQAERLIDAPASVLALDADAIERLSGQAQLPALLSGAAGIQAPQSGLYDFNVNARGFNDLVSRRVRVEVDGRDTSQPHVMGNTDWASLPQALGEFEQLEFVRGPGGALYGQGALNGVMSLRTKDPSRSAGGRARLTFGELGTIRGDARHAGRLGDGWYFKAVGGYMGSDDFAVSRDQDVEYDPGRLPRELVPLASDRLHIAYGSARVDRHIGSGERLELEGGTTYKEGPVTLTNLGRFQATDTHFPWLRSRFQSRDWQVTGAYTLADIDAQLSLASGTPSYQSARNIQLDGQTTRTLARGRTRVVAGGSYNRQRVDSADPQGVQTVFEDIETAQSGSVYGQAEHDITPRVQVSAAARVDATSLTRTTFSPRAALLWEAAAGHRVRVAYSDAYKAPTIAELRLRAPVLAPIDLSGLEAALAPVVGGTPLGFASVPVLAVGNESLDVERLRSLEAGYSVVVGTRTFVQAAYYYNWHDTFTSGLLPQVGTSLGRLNPDFGPYQPPSTLSPAQSAIVQATLGQALPPSLFAVMSNLDDGRPVFALLSLGNFGSARTQGFEASSMSLLPSGWRVDLAYSWFAASVDVDSPETPLQPNTPAHQASAAVHYASERFDAGGRLRVVDGFEWVSGVFAGPVPSYAVVDLQARFPLRQRMTVGIDVANALDNDHYEVFGGDLLGRRALAHLTVDW
jgi:outer membrane receptor protein involved in Fe transport